jgi:geranylgeranyl pyrophosphate synthase
VVFGDGIAILAGDALHAVAFTLLASEGAADSLSPDRVLDATCDAAEICRRKLRVARIVGEAAGPGGMVGGQAIDLQAAGQAPGHPLTLDAEGLRTMHSRKTGALIRAAAVCGAIMAGGSEQVVEAIDRYAIDIGLGFQIVDDILDVEGDAAELGKTAGKDAAGDKATYPKLFGLEQSRKLAADCVDRARQTLREARLTDSYLPAIADWVISRRR